MNWGHKITIVIIVFLISMLGMVFYAFRQTNEMVDDHYYEKEMQYQGVIDAQQNLMDLSTNNMVNQNANEVIVRFPAGSYEKFEQGTIEFLRNDDKTKDLIMPIKNVGYDRQTISKTLLSKGMYRTRISWSSDHKNYYKEENLFVE